MVMATSMGPPLVPAFSLRVQLFSPNAHTLGDKPVRCFRVVTAPDMTIREFCQEASRIHEINYGSSLSIKKCQDDQEFDITQSEIVGNLFVSTATIRIIQASSVSSSRDSVPPTSALRYDPPGTTSRKRDREGSTQPYGSGLSSWKANKRQRVSDLDPDEPLLSREGSVQLGGSYTEQDKLPDTTIIPDSQQRTSYYADDGQLNGSRHVRPDVPRIPETPSPSPPPVAQGSIQFENGSTDHQSRKSPISITRNDLSLLSQASTQRHARLPPSSRSVSASYHIERATERGRSVSTAATSPLSADQHPQSQKEVLSSTNRKISCSTPEAKTNGEPDSRSSNEDSIYDNIESDGEGREILRKTKAALKIKKIPQSGLPGLDWAKKFSTPPSRSNRSLSSNEQVLPTPGELPLTPRSRESQETKRQTEVVDGAKKAQLAAAEAAEQRRRDAEKARRSEEERRVLEEEKLREEKELASKREKERLQNEREAKAQKLEDERKADEKRRELVQSQIEKEAAEVLEIQKAKAEEADRLSKELEKDHVKRKVAASEELRKASDKTMVLNRDKSSSKSTEPPEQPRVSSTGPTKGTPNSTARRQSSTPFIPSGRKPALKSTIVSTKVVASSPVSPTNSSPWIASKGVGIDDQMPLPPKRRVSFQTSVDLITNTPSKPPIGRATTKKQAGNASGQGSIGGGTEFQKQLPNAKQVSLNSQVDKKDTPSKPLERRTPKPPSKLSGMIDAPESLTSEHAKASTRKPNEKFTVVPQHKRSHTPIPVPTIIKRPSTEHGSTPIIQTKAIVPPPGVNRRLSDKKTTPMVMIKSASPAPGSSSTKIMHPKLSMAVKDKSKSVESNLPEVDISSDDSDSENIPSRPNLVKSPPVTFVPPPKPSLLQVVKPAIETALPHQNEVEMASNPSSPRESRSPVVFNQHAASQKPAKSSESAKPPRSASAESSATSSDEKKDVEDSREDEETDDESSDSDEDEEETGETDRRVEAQQSSPELSKANVNVATFKSINQRKMLTGEDQMTQAEVDQQLTSSMYEARTISTTPIPLPPSSHSVRPQFKVGASLQSLNSRKPIYGNSSQVNGSSQVKTQTRDSESSEEEVSDEESESGSSDSSEDDENHPAAKLDASSTADVQPRQKNSKAAKPNDDSDESSDSGEDDDAKAILAQTRNALAAEIAKMGNVVPGTSKTSVVASPTQNSGTHQSTTEGGKKKNKSSQGKKPESRVAGKEFKKTKKLDKIISGYTFTQPV